MCLGNCSDVWGRRPIVRAFGIATQLGWKIEDDCHDRLYEDVRGLTFAICSNTSGHSSGMAIARQQIQEYLRESEQHARILADEDASNHSAGPAPDHRRQRSGYSTFGLIALSF